MGALRRWQWLVWLATRHHCRLALHPNPAAICQIYLLTSLRHGTKRLQVANQATLAQRSMTMKKMTRPITVVVATSVQLDVLLAAVFYGRSRWATGTKSIRSELEAGRVATDPKVFRLTDLVGLPAPVQRTFRQYCRTASPSSRPQACSMKAELIWVCRCRTGSHSPQSSS